MKLPEPIKFSVKPMKQTKEDKARAKLMQTILKSHFSVSDNTNPLYKKVREQMLHEMTCEDPKHMHGVSFTKFEEGN